MRRWLVNRLITFLITIVWSSEKLTRFIQYLGDNMNIIAIVQYGYAIYLLLKSDQPSLPVKLGNKWYVVSEVPAPAGK